MPFSVTAPGGTSHNALYVASLSPLQLILYPDFKTSLKMLADVNGERAQYLQFAPCLGVFLTDSPLL